MKELKLKSWRGDGEEDWNALRGENVKRDDR
jgi:hypothetical protein